jgi:molybdenum cofactor biosynthesis enzyme
MCKAIDKTMAIDGIRLVSKTGGTLSNRINPVEVAVELASASG